MTVHNAHHDLTTLRGCMRFLIDRRHSCRILARAQDQLHDANARDRREVRKLRAAKNPMADRRAKVLEGKIAARHEAISPVNDALMGIGRDLIYAADAIDRHIPRSLLLDLLNVNPADRDGVAGAKGFKELAFVYAVENSVEQRGKDWNDGPLFRALHRRFANELEHNKELKAAAHEKLFGIGGMFEFVPMYQQQPDGSMKRLPPPLRVVDGMTPLPYSREVCDGGGP